MWIVSLTVAFAQVIAPSPPGGISQSYFFIFSLEMYDKYERLNCSEWNAWCKPWDPWDSNQCDWAHHSHHCPHFLQQSLWCLLIKIIKLITISSNSNCNYEIYLINDWYGLLDYILYMRSTSYIWIFPVYLRNVLVFRWNFDNYFSELTEVWSSGATEKGVWIGNYNVTCNGNWSGSNFQAS